MGISAHKISIKPYSLKNFKQIYGGNEYGNKKIKFFKNIFQSTKKMGIIDRLFHHATVVTIKGKSYRLQNYYGEEGR